MKRHFFLILILLLWLCPTWAEQIMVTITAYNAASVSGDAPSVSVQYMQYQKTHYKCRLLAGDTALMQLSSLPSGRLDSVRLRMHSNASSGAGSLEMKLGTRSVLKIDACSFSSEAWAGCYSSDYLPITHVVNKELTDLTLRIISTENSLYWEQLQLFYTPSAPEAYTVYLLSPDAVFRKPLQEESPGAGVVLPSLASPFSGWQHIGWSDTIVPYRNSVPLYYPSGTLYYPSSDTRLFAVYQTSSQQFVLTQTTSPSTGEYAIVAADGWMASGSVGSARIGMQPCEVQLNSDGLYQLTTPYVAPSCRYSMTFDSDTVEILATDGFTIGHTEGSKPYLTDNENTWLWQLAANHSLCIYTHPDTDGRAYVLMSAVGIGADYGSCYLECQRFALNPNEEWLLLFDVSSIPSDSSEVGYSSLTRSSEEMLSSDEIDYGAEVLVYTIDGRLVMSGHLSQSQLPRGLWLVRQGSRVQRVMR